MADWSLLCLDKNWSWLVIVDIWLVGTWILSFHSVKNFIIPSEELICFRGLGIPPTRLELQEFHRDLRHIWTCWAIKWGVDLSHGKNWRRSDVALMICCFQHLSHPLSHTFFRFTIHFTTNPCLRARRGQRGLCKYWEIPHSAVFRNDEINPRDLWGTIFSDKAGWRMSWFTCRASGNKGR